MLTKTDIEKYFSAEKSESFFFIIIGFAAIGLALFFFFFIRSNWHKGAAIPFILVGVIHCIVGFSVYNRSDEDRKRNVYAYDMNPAALKTKELPRMQQVNKNFVIYRYVEIALLLLGLTLFFYCRNDSSKIFWVGLGLALSIEAAVSLGADYFAEKRAKEYTAQLDAFTRNK